MFTINNCWRRAIGVLLLAATGSFQEPVVFGASSAPQTASIQNPRVAAEQASERAWELVDKKEPTDLRNAIVEFQRALHFWQEAGDRNEEGIALYNIGVIYSGLEEHRTALDYFNLALAVSRETGDLRQQEKTLSNIGATYNSLGEYSKALPYLTEGLPIARKLRDWLMVSGIYLNIGQSYRGLTDLQSALDSYLSALSFFELIRTNSLSAESDALGELIKGNSLGEAVALNNIAGVYNELGEGVRALRYLNRALRVEREWASREMEAATLLNMASIRADLGETQNALADLNDALSLFRDAGTRIGEATAASMLAWMYRYNGDTARGLEWYNKSLQIVRELHDEVGEANALAAIGSIYEDLGDHEQALEYLNAALPTLRTIGGGPEAQTLSLISRAERGRGNVVGALPPMQEAVGIIESLRGGLVSPDLRTWYSATARGYYDEYIDLLMQLYRKQTDAGWDVKALEASERSRARSLLDLLTESHVDIRAGIDPGLVERERHIQELLTSKATAKLKILHGPHTLEQLASIEEEIDGLEAEHTRVAAEIRRNNPRYSSVEQPSTLALKEIQQEIDESTMILEYSVGKEHSYLWEVTPTAIRSYELPGEAEIQMLVSRAYDALALQRGAASGAVYKGTAMEEEEAIAAISRVVLGPVTDELQGKRLIIVADGPLHYIPFAALFLPGAGRGARKPLMVDHEIVNLPSASVLAQLRDGKGRMRVEGKMLAVLADPVFSSDDSRVRALRRATSSPAASRRARSSDGNDQIRESQDKAQLADLQLARSAEDSNVARAGWNIPRLKGTREEAKAIQAMVPVGASKTMLDFEANRAMALNPLMAEYRIVHFATHGLLDSQHPELSGLVLSLVNARGQPEDGYLRLQDIFNLNWSADLVVLSACKTGLGKAVRGEGLVGLTRGFMYAGARRVIVSLWKLDDQAAAQMMARFYRAMLQDGLAPAAALRDAQMSMWKDAQFQAPRYWAAFVLIGDWK